MPPEPLPWDHRDKDDKKYDRNIDSPYAGKWRDFGASPHNHHYDHHGHHYSCDNEQPPRLLGPSKHGYQLFPEESAHESMPSQITDLRMLEEESCRLSASSTDGKYLRPGRDNKASDIVSRFGQGVWKGYQGEVGNVCLGSSDRHIHGVTAQRPADDLVSYPSHLLSDVDNSWDQVLFKDQQDRMSAEGLATGHKSGLNFARSVEKDTESRIDRLGSSGSDNQVRDNECYAQDHSLSSLSWKPLKWARSSSLPSRSSGLSQPVSSKSVEVGFDVRSELAGKVIAVQSPKGDDTAGVASIAPMEDTCPRKKQRLGWGQGLAKYEKQKVEGPEEAASKSELVQCANPKTALIQLPSLPEGSTKLTGRLGCTSPATPPFVPCISSPGVVEKADTKVANNVSDRSHFNNSPGHVYLGCAEEFSVDIDNLVLTPHSCINSVLVDLLQSEDPCFGDTNLGGATSLTKLLSLKNGILKALEKTECKIDSFENELKALNSELEINGSRPVDSQPFREADSASKVIQESKYLDDYTQVPLPAVVEPAQPVGHEHLEVSVKVNDEEINGSVGFGSKYSESDLLKSEEGAAVVEAAKISGLEGPDLASTPDSKISEAAGKDDLENCLILNESKTDADSSSGTRFPCEADDTFIALLLASNKNFARKASEVFDELLPTDLKKCNSGSTCNVSCWRDDTHVLEKLAARKSFLRFKERVLTLKFRAFHHLWKEDMRLLSIRKYRPKSHKRFESSTRPSQSVSQKHRSSIRSRFTSPAGNLTLVPTTEMVDFTSKLLSDSHMKLYRNTLNMPALVLDEAERRHSRFITSNGLVEDPFAIEKERAMINPWTSEEREVFMEMLATFGKDFSKIASFLNHKTTADCVEFYYKNHKSESFEKIKKRLELRKQGSCFPVNAYLVTSGKKWHQREANAVSLDILGAASVVAAHAEESVRTHQTHAGRSILGGYFDSKMFRPVNGVLERTSDVEKNGREVAAADVLAGIYGAPSSEAMSSCITSSVDPDEWKCQKKSSARMDRPLTPQIKHNFDEDDTCSDESCGEVGPPIDWTDEEKIVFIEAVKAYGRDFASISRCVGTRTLDQCKIFFSKARKCLGLDGIHAVSGNQITPTSDADGGRSDTEDACVVEMDSAVCSTRSCSKMDSEQHSAINTRNQPVNDVAGTEVDESSGIDEKMGLSNHVGKPVGEDNQSDLVNAELDFNSEDKVVNREETRKDLTLEVTGDKVLGCNLPVWFSEDETATKEHAKEQETDRRVTTSESVCVEGLEELDHSRFDFPVKIKQETKAGSSDETSQEKSKILVQHLCETGSDDREDSKSSSLDVKKSSSFPDSNANRSGSHNPGFSFAPVNQSPVPRELPLQNPHVNLRQQQLQENCPSVPGKPVVLPDPCIAPFYDGHLNPQELRNKQPKSVTADFYQQFLTNRQSLNHQFDQHGLHILRGFPLHIWTKTEDINMTADSIREKPAVIPNSSNLSRSYSQSSQFFSQELYQDNRDGCSKPQHSGSELLFLPKTSKQPDDPLKSVLQMSEKPSSSSEFAEQSKHKTGDVKLFGKILTHTSPMQKPTTLEENEEKTPALKSFNNSSTLKFTSELRTDGASVVPKLEPPSNYLDLEELPRGSFGFWDGSRIQTGLMPLPDPSSMLLRYPAFDDSHQGQGSSCRVDQPPVVKRNEHRSLGGLPVFPTNSSSSVLMDYPPAYLSREPGIDVFAEMQKRNGFDTGQHMMMTGFPCPSRSVVMMGRGILAGEGSGVSDPVAAIKKHYSDRLQAGIREEELWKSDISR